MSGREADAARLVEAEMIRLGYDEVRIDEVGNVIGLLRGAGIGPRLQFNTHLDHVDPGDERGWPYPPYAGEVHNGAIWGRGACDLKGPMAAQIHALAALKAAGVPHQADIYVVAVVFEEMGGLGSRHLAQTLPCDYAVIGEATANELMRGHRGRREIVARFLGRAVHASMPSLGVNPHYSAAQFLTAIRDMPMAQDTFLGSATVAPTLYHTDQVSANVVPSKIALHLDWREVPSETPEGILDRLRQLMDQSLVDGCEGKLSLRELTSTTWTGLERTWPLESPAFLEPADGPLVTAARAALEGQFARAIQVGSWRFATDGGHLAKAGVRCIGFAPGDATLVHTVGEHIVIDEMVLGMAGNMALALALGQL
jgi:putative selenium metabolism hydrolase